METQERIESRIAEELNIKISQVQKTVQLIDEGNTIPFIARYRKEVTRWTIRWNVKRTRRKAKLS